MSLGRIVHYALTEQDVEQISRRRTEPSRIADLIKKSVWVPGVQAHIGNPVRVGQVFAADVVAVDPDVPSVFNLRVKLDGTDVLWVQSVTEGDEPGNWFWPPRV